MVAIELEDDEAIVLFDFLSRFSNDDTLSIVHQSEERVLWDLQCILEKQVGSLFDGSFDEVVSKARLSVADET